MSQMAKFGVIGRDISYSKSKDIFEAMFRLVDLPASFEIHSVEPDHLPGLLNQLHDEGYTGLSVTIPYKETIMTYLNEIDNTARDIRSVNCLSFVNGHLIGANTDHYGFAVSVSAWADRLRNGRALILGCGGAARAVAYSLIESMHMSGIAVWGRSRDRLSEFQAVVNALPRGAAVEVITTTDLATLYGERFDIVVNCTPIGGFNLPHKRPLPTNFDWAPVGLYVDLNYNADIATVQAAHKANTAAMDGSMMLTAQATRSFEIWTGHRLDPVKLHRAVFGNRELS